MARKTFGGTASDWAFTWNSDGSIAQAPGTVLTFWDSLTGGTQYPPAPMPGGVDDGTGLLDGTNTPIASVTCDGNGEIPDSLQGPDGIYKMAADGSGNGTGPRRWIIANDMGDDLTTLLAALGVLPVLQAVPVYNYYSTTSSSYPPRPSTTAPVWWSGPVAPPFGATGAQSGDVWLPTGATTGPPQVLTDPEGGLWQLTVTATYPVHGTGTIVSLPILQDMANQIITDQAGGWLQ